MLELHRDDEQRLRETRRRLSELTYEQEAGPPVTDTLQLAAAKIQAQHEYRQAFAAATDAEAIRQAATTWLTELSRLNLAAGRAARQGGRTEAELNRLEASVRRLQLEVDASRIRAEAARDRCNEARRAAAAAQETHAELPHQPMSAVPHQPAITGLLRGDRFLLHQVAARLAEETAIDGGRLQLLLIELCEGIAASALDASAVSVPPDHEFWGQFDPEEAHSVIAVLSQLGYRFDGRNSWLDERVPASRQLALALAHAGLDSRVRRPPPQAMLESLWRGAQLESVRHLVQRAPDLSLEQVQNLLGVRGAALDELWDHWAHVRRALLN